MAQKRLSHELAYQARLLVERYGSQVAAAKATGIPRGTLQARIRTYEIMDSNSIPKDAPGRVNFEVENGYIVIGSDAHYYPGVISTAHKALVEVCKQVRPVAVVLNGDEFDGASISRHSRIGWDNKPTVKHELEAVSDRLTEIEEAAGTRNLFWPAGNHDSRFETFLASNVPEYQGIDGFRLKDRFPAWKPCWALFINQDLVVKHRFKSGIHAPHNNTMWAGRSIITGHLHSQKVMPFSDYNGTRWGVDCGTMADPYGPQFYDYTELSPVNWRSGFCVVRYKDGELLEPSLVRVIRPGVVQWGLETFEV